MPDSPQEREQIAPARKSVIPRIMVIVVLTVFGITGCLWYASYRDARARLDQWKAQGLPTTASEVNDFYVIPAGVADRTAEWSQVALAVELGDCWPS